MYGIFRREFGMLFTVCDEHNRPRRHNTREDAERIASYISTGLPENSQYTYEVHGV